MRALTESWKEWIRTGLKEDHVAFDWTARANHSNLGQMEATLIAKADGVWAGSIGVHALELVSAEYGMPLEIIEWVKDGESVSPKQKLLQWRGSAESIVTFERTFINLAAYTSGIATLTRAFVDRARAKKLKVTPRITGTRKTLPGYRDLAIQSTLIGGAHPHRSNLSGGLLIKENHIAAAGSVTEAIKRAREVVPHLLKIEIEVKNLAELEEAIQAQAEVIMLDNFSPKLIGEAVKQKPKSGVVFEVSGGVNLESIDQYLIEGVDVISIGALTHSVKALDLSLLI